MKKLCLLSILSLTASLFANVVMPGIFSDHAVLQRSKATAVFGWADAGEKITVSYGSIKAETTAGKDGRFIVKLDLSTAGNDAGELIICGKNKVVIKDVIVGEVWLCTGQSNMALRLRNTLDADAEIKRSANNRIRTFSPRMTTAVKKLDTLNGQWLVASPATSGNFSAVGYYFAKKLNQDAGLAVGLINPAWGGSMIESWICDEHINASTEAVKKSAAAELDNFINYDAKRQAYLPQLLAWEKSMNWIDDKKSAAPPENAKWEKAPALDKGLKGGGIYWLRREVDVPAKNITNGTIQVWLGRPNVSFQVFWDGKKVHEATRARSLELHALRVSIKTTPGKHTLMLRVSATEPYFRFIRENNIFGKNTASGWEITTEKIFPAASKEQLAARPKFLTERPFASKVPHQIYNALIYPIRNYTVKGNLWYQGESNSGKRTIYGEHILALVKCFRETFDNPELRFYAVQLPDYGTKSKDPGYCGSWPTIRARQTAALKQLPFTAEVIILNTGEAKDIHPINKVPVGERLAAVALKYDYGKKDIICTFPEAVTAVREKNQVRITFTNCHGGLKAEKLPENYWTCRIKNQSEKLIPNSPGSQVEGFSLCGKDGKWHWANARIEGDNIIVSSPAVTEPVRVRYAYQNNPNCNLYSNAGLPAGPFQMEIKYSER